MLCVILSALPDASIRLSKFLSREGPVFKSNDWYELNIELIESEHLDVSSLGIEFVHQLHRLLVPKRTVNIFKAQ